MASTSTQMSSSNHGPIIIIATAIMLGSSTMALTIRLYQRWPWSSLFKLEDLLLVSSAVRIVVEIVNTAMVALAVRSGFGRHMNDLTNLQVEYTRKTLSASFALAFLTEGLAASSSAALLQSMDPRKPYQRFITCLMAVTAIWSLTGIARFAAASGPSAGALNISNWIGFAVIGITIQVALFAAAMFTVWPLQMPVHRKLGCSLWLSLCIPVGAVMIVRLVYTPPQTFRNDYTWENINMVIIFIVESNLAIISAAYPSLRGFMNKVSTGLLVPESSNSKSGSKSGGSGAKGGSYGLQTLSSIGTKKVGSRTRGPMLNLGGDTVGRHTTTVRGDTRSDKSFGSQAIMVRRSVEVDELSMDNA